MKVLIWFLCIFATALVTTLIKESGVILGAIPTIILYGATFWSARTLCKKWDEHKEIKAIKKAASSPKTQPTIVNTDQVCYCRKCGEKLIDNSKFCRKCGSPVIAESISVEEKTHKEDDNNESVECSEPAVLLDTDPTENYSTSSDRKPFFHIERGNVYLSVKNWKLARKEFESALTIDPQIAEAYLGLCLSDHHFSTVSELESCAKDLRLDANFMFALKYATSEQQQMLQLLMKKASNATMQRANKRSRQRRRILIAIISLVCFIIIGVGAFWAYEQFIYFPSMYDKGISQLEEGDFEQAASCFDKAWGYSDSDDYYFYSLGMSYTNKNNLEGYRYLKLCENLPESKNILNTYPAYILLSKLQGEWINLGNEEISGWVLVEYSISIENDKVTNNRGSQEYFGHGYIICQGDALWFVNESVQGDKKAKIVILDDNHIVISGIILERQS